MAERLMVDPATLPERLATPEPVVIPDGVADRRAAVTMLLSPEPGVPDQVEALFGIRATVEGDPWSGHVALPGGRQDPEDDDLLDTARREMREETGIRLARDSFVGRLDDLHPRSAHLPSIVVTPYVAWLSERPVVNENRELAGHVWIPVTELSAAERRSRFELDEPRRRTFDTIEYAGVTVWGLTFVIVEDFLRRIGAG